MRYANWFLNLSFALLCAIFAVLNFFPPKDEVLARVEDYSRTNAPVVIGDLGDRVDHGLGVAISLSFKMPSASDYPSNDSAYQDLFQTADVNSGIRLEIQAKNKQVVSWALIIGNREGKAIGVDLGAPPESGIAHTVRIVVNEDSVDVTLDGRNPISVKSDVPRYLTNNLVVGRGFSGERTFSGEMRRFEITSRNPVAVGIEKYQIDAVVALLLILLWLFFAPPGNDFAKRLHGGAFDFELLKFVTWFAAYFAFFIYHKTSYFALTGSGASGPSHTQMS